MGKVVGRWFKVGQVSEQTRPINTLLVLGVVVLAIWIPRTLVLDRFATFDERIWLTRSANFYCALGTSDLTETFQSGHPGVITMWAGTMGFLWKAPTYHEQCAYIERSEHEQVLHERGFEPIELIEAGRFFIVLYNTAVLVLAFLFARRLVGTRPALVGFLLIAFDPFHLAHSRLLHVDGSVSSSMVLALLAYVCYLRERRPLWLILSGIAAGLSYLNKSPGFFLIPFVGGLTLVHHWGERTQTRLPMWIWQIARPILLWGVIGAITVLSCWPAMRVDPGGTLSRVIYMAEDYSTGGHCNPVFFGGKVFADGKLDASFVHFYPLAFLYRSTPVAWLGILAAGIALACPRRLPTQARERYAIGALLAFAVIFGAAINLSAKKFDRYLLPIYAPLDLVAGVGWVILVRWLRSKLLSARYRYTPALILTIAVVAQAASALGTFPYYLSYYNPVLGGGQTASKLIMVGWGEGLDQAARYLNAKPNAEQMHVVSWYYHGCLSYFFKGTSNEIAYPGWCDINFQEALNADYAVVYHTHQMQRDAPRQLLDYLAEQAPEQTIYLNGLEYVRIYKMDRGIYDDPAYRPVNALLGNQILLEGFRLPQQTFVPGEDFVLSLSWRAIEQPDDRLKVFVQVLNSDGVLVAQHDGEPEAWSSHTNEWQPGEKVKDCHGISLPADLPAGEYTLIVGMYRFSGERLSITQAGEPTRDALTLQQISIRTVESPIRSTGTECTPSRTCRVPPTEVPDSFLVRNVHAWGMPERVRGSVVY